MYLLMKSRTFVAKFCDGGDTVGMVLWVEYLAHSHLSLSGVIMVAW